MNAAANETAGPAAPAEGVIASRDDFHRALRAGLQCAAEAGSAALWFSDADFADWPLGAPATVEALTRWVGARRRLTLLAADYGVLAQRHPRWHAWRRRWSHAVECLVAPEELAASVPTLLYVPQVLAVRLHDRVRSRGRVLRGEADLAACGDALDALSQRSTAGLPVTTLGL